MRIAIIFEGHENIGGGFSFQNSYLNKKSSSDNEYIFYSNSDFFINHMEKNNIEHHKIKNFFLDKFKKLLFHFNATYFILPNLKLSFEKQLINDKIDLAYFLSPNYDSFYFNDINFALNVWDNCHIDHPEFPEVRKNFEFEKRELFYNKVLKKATSIIVESNITKNNLVRRYGIDKNKIEINNFLNILDKHPKYNDSILETLSIKTPYVFYPSQFWSHKNHTYILDALHTLKSGGIKIGAVFCGSDQGNLDFVKKYSEGLGISESVCFLGYVSEEAKNSLFRSSLAVVVPSFFGPTNLPQIEAAIIGVPSIIPMSNNSMKFENEFFIEVDLFDSMSLVKEIKNLLLISNYRIEKINLSKRFLLKKRMHPYHIVEKVTTKFKHKLKNFN